MADYYVDYSTGNDTTGNGSSTTPWKTLKKATDTVTAGDHRIFVSNTAADVISTGTTYTVAAGVAIYSASGVSTTYSRRTAKIQTSATNASITLNGGKWFGIVFEMVASSSSTITVSSGSFYTELHDCEFKWLTGATGTSGLQIGNSASAYYTVARFIDCDYTTTNVIGDGTWFSGFLEWIGGSWPTLTQMFQSISTRGTQTARFEGVDLSGITTLVHAAPGQSVKFEFVNCKLKSDVIPLASSPNDGIDVYLYDCASGDTHYNFAHYNKYGSTVATTGTYAANGAEWDGTNGISWTVTSTASASSARPYYTPWISVYHDGTSSISPYVESMRTAASGAGTYYTDAEVWSEWLVKTGGSDPRVTFYSDRAALPDTTGSTQAASSLGAGDWTGELATYSFAKLGTTFTPADKGHISVRVAVGKASVTDLFIDPFVRGLS